MPLSWLLTMTHKNKEKRKGQQMTDSHNYLEMETQGEKGKEYCVSEARQQWGGASFRKEYLAASKCIIDIPKSKGCLPNEVQ